MPKLPPRSRTKPAPPAEVFAQAAEGAGAVSAFSNDGSPYENNPFMPKIKLNDWDVPTKFIAKSLGLSDENE